MPTLTKGVKYILIANIIVFVLGFVLSTLEINIDDYGALYYISSAKFKPMQFFTYMFLHGSLMHIFFNMFALVQFGSVIESFWGSKRFTFYYIVTGLGAAIVNTIVNYYQIQPIKEITEAYVENPSLEAFIAWNEQCNVFKDEFIDRIVETWQSGQYPEQEFRDETIGVVQRGFDYFCDKPMVGASGAIFGILLAFGMMFPDLKLQIIFIPIGIPAKYFVVLYGAIELVFGIQDFSWDNVAHFAHLGGMLFGLILLLWWRKNPHNDIFN